jgi:hypothetical protein
MSGHARSIRSSLARINESFIRNWLFERAEMPIPSAVS